MSTRLITFTIGEENRPVIEDIDKDVLKNSIFSDQYNKALSVIDDYVGFSSKIREGKRCAGNEKTGALNFSDSVDNNNNIFAFVGERGSGKTSCMMSVVNLLLKEKSRRDFIKGENLRLNNFYGLDLIDPSFFDDKHNILAVFVAQLYKQYKERERYEPSSYSDNLNQKRTLLERFSETQKNLSCILDKQQEQTEDLERLVALAAAVNLKQNIRELVDAFLEYIGKKDSILLLAIDDIDLHSREATEMVEQIRKYLIHPNIVILMAVKLDQLAMLKRLQYTQEYEKLLKEGAAMTSDLIEEMTERYMTKLVPHNQRIFLPDVEAYIFARLKIEPKKENEVEEYSSIRHAVLELIFQKTRYLFYNTSTNTSYIVPRNLRELRMLMKLLKGMPNFRDCDSQKQEQNTYNKQLFKKYFFESWVINNLNSKEQQYVNEILQVTDAAQINHRVLKVLSESFPDFFKSILEKVTSVEREIGYIQREGNMVYNISLGDVLGVIDLLERQYTDLHSSRFLFILKSIYSMRLYEYYDEKTEAYKQQNSESKDQGNDEKVLRNDNLAVLDLDNYDKLVAGRFINSRIVELLPTPSASTNKQKEVSRSNRIINIAALHELIKECIEHWKEESVEDSKTIDTIFEQKVQLAEFFMLCISRGIDTKNKDEYESLFRTNRTVYYAESLEAKKKNVLFDINSFFYNVTRIKACYKRFKGGKEFLEYACKSKISLVNAFKEATCERYHIGSFSMGRWLSWCSIRNVEVLQDLQEQLENVDYRTGDDIEILGNFFYKINLFNIEIYDRDPDKDKDKESYYSIEFSFAESIVSLLNNVCKDADMTKCFNSIFSYNNVLQNGPVIIDIEDIRKTISKKRTFRNTILEKYPMYSESIHLNRMDRILSKYGNKLTRDEIEEVVKRLNS
jgi:ABC-type dipeptide/oligopeptide/nickel transport system ATPase component